MARNSGMRGSGGGGYGSRSHVEKGVRVGDTRKGISPGWVSQKGQLVGDHVTNRGDSTGYKGEPKFDGKIGISVPLGNQVALNVGKGGPGTGRDPAMRSGSQGQHGPVAGNEKPAGRDILSNFGPDYKR